MTVDKAGENGKIFSHLTSICIFTFLVFSLLRVPTIFFEPRFWAEEGAVYFNAIKGLDWFHAVSFSAKSNVQILTNILVSVSTAVSASWAPHVTTYGSILIACGLPYSMARAARDNAIDPLTVIIGSALVASVPMSFEIFGTSTNVQWYSAAALFFVIFWRFESPTPSIWLMPLAILYGWSGVPAAMLFPAFVVVGFARNSRPHIIIAGVLLAASLIQLHAITNGPTMTRQFVHYPSVLVFPTVLPSILGLWMSPSLMAALGSQVLTLADKLSLVAISAVILSLPVKLAAGTRLPALFALFVGFCASLTQTFAAVDDATKFIMPVTGGRYYLISTSAIIMAFMFASISNKWLVRSVLLLALVVNVSGWYSRDWSVFTVGREWSDVLNECSQPTCTLPIWPEGWSVEIDR